MLTYALLAKPTPLIQAAKELLLRSVRERTGLGLVRTQAAEADLLLDVAPGAGPEGFALSGEPGEPLRLTGHDDRGLLYGVGKLLRDARLAPGICELGPWRGSTAPQRPVRGIYFATHFHNWYHDAPLDEVVRYIEELALWGCNALSVWFDMHHYQGIDDPAAQALLERLRSMLRAANRVGMGASLTLLANEAYASSPPELRADWTAGHDGYHTPPRGHYHVEICPSQPGGTELILRWREEVLQAFAGIDLRYIWIWPYDQGGCTCRRCAPWGTHAFLKLAEPLAAMARHYFPQAQIVLSTWYFDRFIAGEWAGLTERFNAQRPEWADYLMIDDFGGFPAYPLEHGVPGGLPVLGFAEISMEGMGPWGGFGANPRPANWQAYHDKTRALMRGNFPYSEGIYEDINKALMLGWGWDSERTADEILHEYAAGYFAPELADDVVQAMHLLEADHGIYVKFSEGVPQVVTNDLSEAEACLALLNRLDAALPEEVRSSWRWRVLWLRAALDAEVKANGGRLTARTDVYTGELVAIYHAQRSEPYTKPPLRA